MHPKKLRTSLALVAFTAALASPVLAGEKGGRPKGAKTANKAAAKAAVPIISEGELRALLKGHRGKPVVLHFWATWCAPCITEMPNVVNVAYAAKERGVEFVAISLDDPTAPAADKVTQVMNRHAEGAFTTKIVKVDDPDQFVAGVDPRWQGDIPAFFAYDKTGNLRRAHVGEITRADFDKLIAGL